MTLGVYPGFCVYYISISILSYIHPLNLNLMPPQIVAYLVISLIAFMLAAAILRWVFMVEKGRKYQRANMKLLSEIASKLGVENDRIDDIQREVKK